MIIAFDFDGTVVDHRFPEIGPAVPGAMECLRALMEEDHKLILYTMRSDDPTRDKNKTTLTEAVAWLKQQRIRMWGVNVNPGQKHWSNSPKVYAELYIDDAALGIPKWRPAGFEMDCVDWDKVRIMLVQAKILPEV